MFLRVTHVTRYRYAQPVSFAPHALYLRPRDSHRQRLHNYELKITPAARLVPTLDAEGNTLEWAYFDLSARSSQLEIRSDFLIETFDANPFDFFLRLDAIDYPFTYNLTERSVLSPSLVLPYGSDAAQLRAWLAEHLPSPPRDTVQLVTALNTAVYRALRYSRRDEPGIQTPSETLAREGGSCRDFAVFFISLCRLLGLAARFVSGYLYETPPADGTPQLPTAMHAWAEVFLPGGGWRGLDSTRGVFCSDAFVPIASSAFAEAVNPTQGAIFADGTVASELTTQLTVVPC